MAKSPEELAHQEWLGYVQPLGLVVSIPAMLEAQCYVNKNIAREHAQFLSCLPRDGADEPVPEIRDLREFTHRVLAWEPEDLIDVPQGRLSADMAALEAVIPQYEDRLLPTHAVPTFRPEEGQNPWTMLLRELPTGTDLDDDAECGFADKWREKPQAKFERLMRETGIPIGLLSNRRQLRLVYAPKGESSGHATFNVDEMMQVAGRPMFAALHMLLNSERMFSLGDKQRLPSILESSRRYQNTVSTKLAEQVLAALYELMRGFQAANDVSEGKLLKEVLTNNPNHVYSGLLTVLMRLVFVMYAEDRDLLSSDPVYSNHYSVTGLFNRLREEAGRFPDTMNQRFGAWSQLITLFRLVYEGGQHGEFKLPARKGYLFDPERYPFLEGRQLSVPKSQSSDTDTDNRQPSTDSSIPRVSDGIVFNVLQNLLILDGERLSYRTLDVEQIGSVYETVMGFNLEVAAGKSIAIKPVKSHGAPATINLEALLETKGKDRAKWFKEVSDQKLGAADAKSLKEASDIDELFGALNKKVAKKVTPRIVPAGAIVLQPSDERRRSGSHYTPRSLTEPIVRTTLEPILKQLCDADADLSEVYEPSREDKKRYTAGELDARIRASEKAIEYAKLAREVGSPHPLQILDLKICDPAMGSGAFLVEACRQLGDHLIDAWAAHDLIPTDIPPDEDEVLYARRQVAQRCLYGVDKNIMAVDLAKLSLWLVTLAKDHPFTFLDHSLRHGDSLVGLTRRQIIGFHWEPKKQKQFGEDLIQKRLDRATEARAKILNAREDVPYRDQEQRLAVADEALNVVRLTGDACVSAFFAGSKKKEREDRCDEIRGQVEDWYASGHDINKRGPIAAAAASLRSGEHPIPPFHWEIEFPEVFSRANGGFDAFVGNPPFIGGTRISTRGGKKFVDFIIEVFDEMGNRTDLVAYFFRQCFSHLRQGGTFGLIATQTIAQGDTRVGGLEYIRRHGGNIYSARTRVEWAGVAAVIVSVIHIAKGTSPVSFTLNSRTVEKITSYLFHTGSDTMPEILKCNSALSFSGVYPYGSGFQFSDDDPGATPLSRKDEIILTDPRYKQLVHAYIGGKEILNDPKQAHSRYVINFREMNYEEAEAWPLLLEILREKAKPERESKGGAVANWPWWRFWRPRETMLAGLKHVDRYLAHPFTTSHLAFTFLPSTTLIAAPHIAILLDSDAAFGLLQSRVHEVWTRFFSSTLKDDLRYSFSDCFDNFPFPEFWHSNSGLITAGRNYYDHRLAVTVQENEGLTKTYNRFHDPHEKSSEIAHLRELHAAMDRAVLEAYGWDDLAETATCEFLLDYEEDDDDTVSSSGGGAKKSKKKKPWRLRWPDDFRDEVLARLLELNEQRHKEELLLAKHSTKAEKEAKKKANSSGRKIPGL